MNMVSPFIGSVDAFILLVHFLSIELWLFR